MFSLRKQSFLFFAVKKKKEDFSGRKVDKMKKGTIQIVPFSKPKTQFTKPIREISDIYLTPL